MPKVSIIVTAFNSEKYIRESILSVSSQTESDIEIIVVDDGSVDDTVKLAQDLSTGDNRIKVHPQPHRGKPSITRNAGMKLAQGKYICFLDADDRYDPDKVRRQLEVLESNPRLAATFHDMRYMNESGESITGTFLRDKNFLECADKYLSKTDQDLYVCSRNFYKFMSLNFAAIHTSAIMVRSSLIKSENILFPEDVRIGEDTQVWWLIAIGREIAYIDKVLSHYRLHDASVTKDKNVIQYYKDVITVHIRNFERGAGIFDPSESMSYKKIIAQNLASLGHGYYLDSRHKEARHCFRDANHWYWSKGSTLGYIKTFVPPNLIRKLKGIMKPAEAER